MDELEIFRNDEFGEVRTVVIDGEPWFVGKDVSVILGYRMASDMTRRIDNEDKATHSVRTLGGQQNMTVINESGLYVAILGSKLESAKRFKKWITSEVLPTIRKTGGYVSNDELFINTYLPFADDQTKQLFSTTLLTIRKQNEVIQNQKKTIEEQKPKVDFHDKVALSDSTDKLSLFGKVLDKEFPNLDIGPKKIFKILRNKNILMQNNIPYQRYITAGYFTVKETVNNGMVFPVVAITGKGKSWLVKKLNEF